MPALPIRHAATAIGGVALGAALSLGAVAPALATVEEGAPSSTVVPVGGRAVAPGAASVQGSEADPATQDGSDAESSPDTLAADGQSSHDAPASPDAPGAPVAPETQRESEGKAPAAPAPAPAPDVEVATPGTQGNTPALVPSSSPAALPTGPAEAAATPAKDDAAADESDTVAWTPELRDAFQAELIAWTSEGNRAHIESLSDAQLDRLMYFSQLEWDMNSEVRSAELYVSEEGREYFELMYGPEGSKAYFEALTAAREQASRKPIVAWYKKYNVENGKDEHQAQYWSWLVFLALGVASDEVEPEEPFVPEEPPVRPAGKPSAKPTVEPAKPVKPVVARPAAQGEDLAKTGVDSFGAAGLGVLALLGGVAIVGISRRRVAA